MVLDNPQLINIHIKASVMTQSVICSSAPLTPSEENMHRLAAFSHHLRECFGNTITSLVHPLWTPCVGAQGFIRVVKQKLDFYFYC